MKRKRRDRVFVRMNSEGQVAILNAEEHRKQVARLSPPESLPAPPIGTPNALDPRGRLKLPTSWAPYLRSLRPDEPTE